MGEFLRLAAGKKLFKTTEPRAPKGRKMITATKITPLTEIEQKEIRATVEDAIKKLPANQRTIIEKSFYQDKTIQQTAAETGTPVKKTAALYKKALQDLAKNPKLKQLFKPK